MYDTGHNARGAVRCLIAWPDEDATGAASNIGAGGTVLDIAAEAAASSPFAGPMCSRVMRARFLAAFLVS